MLSGVSVLNLVWIAKISTIKTEKNVKAPKLLPVYYSNMVLTDLWPGHQLGRRTASCQEIRGFRFLLRQRYCHRYSGTAEVRLKFVVFNNFSFVFYCLQVPPTCAVYRHWYSPWRRSARSVLSHWSRYDRLVSQVWKLLFPRNWLVRVQGTGYRVQPFLVALSQ